MPRVQRANVVLRVTEDEVQHYLKLGYALTSDSGKKVLKDAVPHDVTALQTSLVEAQNKIAALEEQVAKLTVELQNAKAAKPKKAPSKKAE